MNMIQAPEWLPIGLVYGALGALVLWLGPRAFTFVRAITSGWNAGNVKKRLKICQACHRVKKKSHVDGQGKVTEYLYCDECKCGSHHIAELNTKLGFNNLKCPIGKWGPNTGITVHEGHDLLVNRDQQEFATDQRERTNILAGRPRDYVEPQRTNNSPPTPVPAGQDRNAQALELKRQSQLRQQQMKVQAAQRHVKKEPVAGEAQRSSTTQINRAGTSDDETNASSSDATDTRQIWNEEQQAALAGVDHEGQILVDQEQDDGGQTLHERDR